MSRPDHPRSELDEPLTPPFWIAQSVGEARVDDRVTAEARALWPWFHSLVVRRLRDGPRAAQILDQVATNVSSRLAQDPRVADNLRGYLVRAFLRQVNGVAQHEARIQYLGLARDLESVVRPKSPDWLLELELNLVIDAIAECLEPDMRRVLNFRKLSYSWRFIAIEFETDEQSIRNMFYYRYRRAAQALLGSGVSK